MKLGNIIQEVSTDRKEKRLKDCLESQKHSSVQKIILSPRNTSAFKGRVDEEETLPRRLRSVACEMRGKQKM